MPEMTQNTGIVLKELLGDWLCLSVTLVVS